MRKFFLIVCMLCMYVSTVHAQTNIYTGANQDFSASIYGDINVDMMYSYGSDSNYANKAMLFSNGYHSFGSQSFLEDSYFGVNLSYKNLSMLFELGFSDYIRKYVVKYDFKDKYGQFVSVGRDETMAFYEMGQTLNSYQGLTGFGALNADNRRLQVRYGIENFEVALIFPFLSDDYEQANDNAFFARNFNNAFLGFSAIPRLEAAYHYIYNDILSLKAFASYGAYIYRQEHTYKQDVVHTASLGAGGRYYWLTKGFLDFTGWAGLNLYQTNALTNNKLNPVNGYIKDNYQGAVFTDGFGHNDIISFGAAVAIGYEFEKDNIKYVPQLGLGYTGHYSDIFADIDHDAGAYVNVTVGLNDFIDIIPEIAFMHSLNDGYGISEGFNIMAGVTARFRF